MKQSKLWAGREEGLRCTQGCGTAVMDVPEDPAPRGCWKRERNPVCGVLLASGFAPL